MQIKSDDRRPKKRFRFSYGKLKNKVIEGDEAIQIYDSLSMQRTRYEVDGEVYVRNDRKIDDDGTLEITMACYS